MNTFQLQKRQRPRWICMAAALSLMLLSGCNAIRPLIAPAQNPNYFSLSYAPPPVNLEAPGASMTPAETLVVSPPHAAAGFDSQRMMYLRHTDQLEYFAYNEWIDTPARMLAPLIVTAVANSGAFRAVVQTPSAATGTLRLDTEVMRLQQEFQTSPGRVRFTLRAYLVEIATRRVIALREFEGIEFTDSEDPHRGVVAVNRAVKTVLDALAAFCAEAARSGSSAGAAAH